MICWKIGRVLCLAEQRDGYQEVLVKLESPDFANDAGPKKEKRNPAAAFSSPAELTVKAAHYTDIFPPLKEGDRVLLNTTGLELNLGSGGLAFVCAIVQKGKAEGSQEEEQAEGTKEAEKVEGTREFMRHQPSATGGGHLMKLRYTPMQRAVLAAEEKDSPYHLFFGEAQHLRGTPVLIGELHSMLPAAVCWLQSSAQGEGLRRIAYVMTDGGALPLAFSRNVALLKKLGWICGTVTYGHAYGGDLETMNKFSALIAARHALQSDLIIVTMGPGIAGTGTYWGHTAVEVGELINAAATLGGVPIVIPRISFADSRKRHKGLSHHLLASLSRVALRPAVLPLPACLHVAQRAWIERQLRNSGCGRLHEIRWVDNVDAVKMHRAFSRYPQEMMTMGRQPDEDESFFLSVCAAASCALSWIRNESET